MLARMQSPGPMAATEVTQASRSEARKGFFMADETLGPAAWNGTLSTQSHASLAECPLTDENLDYWISRLALRRHPFPPAGGSDQDWFVRLDYSGAGYWFPLGTANRELAAENARRIYQTILEEGWRVVFKQHTRELILSFEWCSSPILWTYTTIHTVIEPKAFRAPVDTEKPASYRVIVVEPDEGIRWALQWCVNQQAGFACESCATLDSVVPLCSVQQPSLVLLNRSLAGDVGVKLSGALAAIKPGPVVEYSVFDDGDQIFASMPGGADAYMLKRVPPANILEPVLGVVRHPNAQAEDFIGAVKCCFKDLLHARPDASARSLPMLTPRENDVLRLLSTGCSDREIARALGIGFWTVHDHLKRIFRRLGVRTRSGAAACYLE